MLDRVPPHLTLVPPVNVREDDVGAALATVRTAAGRSRPIALELGPPATFLPVSPVLYLAVGGGTELQRLRDEVFQPPLARSLTWAFVPHVTIADQMDEGRIAAALTALADYRVSVVFDAVHVLQEGPGRVWTPVADVLLGPEVVIGRGGLPLTLTVSTVLDPEALAVALAELVPSGAAPLVVTARRDGRVVGVLQGWTAGVSGQVTSIAIAPEAMADDVDRHLLAEARSQAAARECELLEKFSPD